MNVDSILGALRQEFPAEKIEPQSGLRSEAHIVLPPDCIHPAVRLLVEQFDLYHLSTITGQDTGDKIELLYHFWDGQGLTLCTSLSREDARIDTLLSDLQNAAIISATGAHWEEADYDYWAMNTDTRSTAVILDALARVDPENNLIPNVVRWLMVARRDGIWETTYETAWALMALTDWMRVTREG